jgi:hypothetical protein
MVALGRAIIDGLMQGLREKMDELFALARRIAARVRETLEDALRIGSPSQVMADIGRAMMEGWQVGIERGAERPVSALERASGAVVGNVGGAQSLAPLPVGGSSGAVTINLYADVLDESAAARVFDALESEARRGLVSGRRMMGPTNVTNSANKSLSGIRVTCPGPVAGVRGIKRNQWRQGR